LRHEDPTHDEPYFPPGTPGYAAETRAWGTAKREEDKGDLYMVMVGEKKTRH
jgi:hypothetical protein